MTTSWTEDEINTYITLYQTGMSIQDIADEMGRSRSSVKMFGQRHRTELGLVKRIDTKEAPKTKIDKQWYGSVPYKHWLITKKWSRA